jgi:hypothetical protein
LSSVLAGGQWLASRSGSFTPKENAPVNHWIEGLVGPRTGMADLYKKSCLYWDPRSDPSTDQPLTSRHTHDAIPDLQQIPEFKQKSMAGILDI